MALIEGILHENAKKRRGQAHVSILQTVTVGMIKEWAALGTLHELRIIGRDGTWFRVRPSGRLRLWKRDPHRVELPVKYGMYESLTLTSSDFDGGKVAVIDRP